MHLRNRVRVLETAEGGTGGGGNPAPTPPPADPLAGLQRLLERQSGDAGRVAELLYRENYELRERNRQLAGQTPPQGAVVLTPDQATAWQAYQALGAPDALRTAMQEREQAVTRLTTLEREQLTAAAAAAHQYHPAALARLIAQDNLTITIQETTQDGQTVRTALVTPPNGQPTPLPTYAQQQWSMFLPALQTGQTPAGSPPRVPPQSPAGTGTSGDLVNRYIQQTNEARDAAPNPLIPRRS